MSQKTLVIGIGPEYEYPGQLNEWNRANTRYASNLGACLITNAIVKQFDGDYCDDFSDPAKLSEQYDICVLAFATHIHPGRDIWEYTNFVEKLDIPTYFISGGITDYAGVRAQHGHPGLSDYTLHPSVTRMLEIVASGTEWIGVRGHYTAAALQRCGFRRVVPIGCPTLYWNLDRSLEIPKPDTFSSPLIPYHLTLAKLNPQWAQGTTLLGQDFQDEVVFTSNLEGDERLKHWLTGQFKSTDQYNQMLDLVKSQGDWVSTFAEWYERIGSQDFVVGPRLHGCICALIQGIPAVMTTRDLRVQEVAQFFDIPHFEYDDIKDWSLQQLYDRSSFEKFHRTHKRRLNNYLQFLKENNLKSKHTVAPSGFQWTQADIADRQYVDTSMIATLSDRNPVKQEKPGLKIQSKRTMRRVLRKVRSATLGR